jgi:TRAP-type mannitol/chloroaromatic compound transport system substrate-binding protein
MYAFVRRPLRLAAMAVFASMTATATAHAQEHEWKMTTAWSGGPLMEIGAKAFAQKVKELTNGRVEIQVFVGGQLGKALDVTRTVNSGIAEVGHTWMGYDWGQDTTTVVFGGFAGSMNSELMAHWLYEGGGVELWRQFRDEKFGVISMPMFMRPAEVFLHSRKPVRTLEDLQGLKLRTAGAWLEMSKELGAAPVTMPGAEVYTSLERGVIDATEWGTLWENVSEGFHKIAKYIIIPGVHQPVAPFEVMFNKEAWAELSNHDKRMVEEAAELVTFESWTKIGQEDAKALDLYREAGNEIIVLDDEVQIATKEIAYQWADGQAKNNPWFKKVWQSQLDFLELWAEAEEYRNPLPLPVALQK